MHETVLLILPSSCAVCLGPSLHQSDSTTSLTDTDPVWGLPHALGPWEKRSGTHQRSHSQTETDHWWRRLRSLVCHKVSVVLTPPTYTRVMIQSGGECWHTCGTCVESVLLMRRSISGVSLYVLPDSSATLNMRFLTILSSPSTQADGESYFT